MVLKLCQLEDLVSVMLSPEADRIFTVFRRWVEPQLAEDGGELAYMSDWAGKLPGAVARIAGILHTVEHIDDDIKHPISGDTMQAAIEIGRYLIPHAQAAIAATQQATPTNDCRLILNWIRRKNKSTFTHRDVHKELETHFEKSEDLAKPLEDLVHRDYIRPLPSDRPSGKPGRKPSPRYEAWPGLFKTKNDFQTPEMSDRKDTIGDWPPGSPPNSPKKPNSVHCVRDSRQIENESKNDPDGSWRSI
jgi:replicative DNA helicase